MNELDTDLTFVCEMSNKYKEETLLPMNIWIDETGSYINGGHCKRIKFQLNKADKFENGNTASMDLDGNIYPENFKIKSLRVSDLNELRNFVHNNKYALERIADQDLRLYKIWPYMIKGGKMADEDDVNWLNAKVDELMLEGF